MVAELLNKWLSQQRLLLALAMETPPSDPRVEEKLEGQLRRSLKPLAELEGGAAFLEGLLAWSRSQDPAILAQLEGEELAPLWEKFTAIAKWKK